MIIFTIVLHIFATNFIGEVLGVKSVPIEFGLDGKRRSLHIKDSMELEIKGLKMEETKTKSHV